MVDLKITLPEGFLEQEERCGYVIPAWMKQVWAVELDLLAEFQRVCEEHQLEWFPEAGTLLGAVRHQGFIPWDDDIDVMMKRADYNRLCEIADQAFSHPYFFQTEYSDPGSLRGHAQLRNSNTAAFSPTEIKRGYGYNKGIFIDVFPYDNVPDDPKERRHFLHQLKKAKHKMREHARWTSRFEPNNTSPTWMVRRAIRWWRQRQGIADTSYRDFEALAAKYNHQDTEELGLIIFKPATTTCIYRRHDYDDKQLMPFEMLQIPVPLGYDNILTRTYGNWHEFVRGGGYHGGLHFDTDHSYKDYEKGNKQL